LASAQSGIRRAHASRSPSVDAISLCEPAWCRSELEEAEALRALALRLGCVLFGVALPE